MWISFSLSLAYGCSPKYGMLFFFSALAFNWRSWFSFCNKSFSIPQISKNAKDFLTTCNTINCNVSRWTTLVECLYESALIINEYQSANKLFLILRMIGFFFTISVDLDKQSVFSRRYLTPSLISLIWLIEKPDFPSSSAGLLKNFALDINNNFKGLLDLALGNGWSDGLTNSVK